MLFFRNAGFVFIVGHLHQAHVTLPKIHTNFQKQCLIPDYHYNLTILVIPVYYQWGHVSSQPFLSISYFVFCFYFFLMSTFMSFVHFSFCSSINISLTYKYSLNTKNIFLNFYQMLKIFFFICCWLCFNVSFLCQNVRTCMQCYLLIFISTASEFWHGVYSVFTEI